jgi:hypothetical protein
MVVLLVPGCLLAGCQGAGSSYPLFSIPGVTRISPPASWQHGGDAKYYPDLAPATSGPVENEGAERVQGASLNWVPHGESPAASGTVVQATFEQPVGSGILGNPAPRLLQPTIGARPLRPAEKMTDEWSSRHDPH